VYLPCIVTAVTLIDIYVRHVIIVPSRSGLVRTPSPG
jgi:hypothetical protein